MAEEFRTPLQDYLKQLMQYQLLQYQLLAVTTACCVSCVLCSNCKAELLAPVETKLSAHVAAEPEAAAFVADFEAGSWLSPTTGSTPDVGFLPDVENFTTATTPVQLRLLGMWLDIAA